MNNQSCREFEGDHFYILDIEFGRKNIFHFLTQQLDFFDFSSLWTVHRKSKKYNSGTKNQSCCQFGGDHFYILDIEFGRFF